MAYFGMAFCPNCKKPVEFTMGAGFRKSKIGQPTFYKCKHCGEVYSDGMKEWRDMSALEKGVEIFRFACIDVVVMLVAGVLLALGIGIALDSKQSTMLIIFLCAAVLALGVSIFLNVRKIRQSNKRRAEAENE